MAGADSRVSRSYDLDDSHKETPMWVLSLATLDRLGNFLNNRKLLKTEDGELRDYRGLEDQAKLSPEERGRVEGSNNKAGKNLSHTCIECGTIVLSTLLKTFRKNCACTLLW